MNAREARLAAAKAARANWPAPEPPAEPDTRPACTVPSCTRRANPDQAGRCPEHWQPLRDLVATMAGATDSLRTSRRAFSAAMSNTTMRPERWADLADYDAVGAEPEVQAVLDEATRALYAAGYYVGVGPRGGRYLARRAAAEAVAS